MSKIKTYENNLIDQLQNVATNVGFVLMASAAVLGTVELSEGREKIVLAQPALAYANHDLRGSNDELMRREKESEVGQHGVSYGVSMRTPSRAGKQ